MLEMNTDLLALLLFVGLVIVMLNPPGCPGTPFCSSRRRHTRLSGDWSSDVCSSDLARPGSDGLAEIFRVVGLHELHVDSQAPEAHVELGVGAAVERAGRDNLGA